MNYKPISPEFTFGFEGYNLKPETSYSLIYYADKPERFVNWGGNNPGALLSELITDVDGNVNVLGSVELNMNLPHEDDANIDGHDYTEAPDNYDNAHGAKIWLVLSDDYGVDTNKMTDWRPDEYLFETDLINYIDGPEPELVPVVVEETSSPSLFGLGMRFGSEQARINLGLVDNEVMDLGAWSSHPLFLQGYNRGYDKTMNMMG